jgi:hypothetical protein
VYYFKAKDMKKYYAIRHNIYDKYSNKYYTLEKSIHINDYIKIYTHSQKLPNNAFRIGDFLEEYDYFIFNKENNSIDFYKQDNRFSG